MATREPLCDYLAHVELLEQLELFEITDDNLEEESTEEIRSPLLEEFNELNERIKSYFRDLGVSDPQKKAILEVIQKTERGNEEYELLYKEYEDLVLKLVGTNLVIVARNYADNQDLLQAAYFQITKRLALDLSIRFDIVSLLRFRELAKLENLVVKFRMMNLLEICKNALGQGDAQFQKNAKDIVKILKGDFSKYYKFKKQKKVFKDLKAPSHKRWYLERFDEAIEIFSQFLTYDSQKYELQKYYKTLPKMTKKIFMSDIHDEIFTDDMFFAQFLSREFNKAFFMKLIKKYDNLFTKFFGIELEFYYYFNLLERYQTDHPVVFKFIFDKNRMDKFYNYYRNPPANVTLLSTYLEKWFEILIPKVILKQSFLEFYDRYIQYFCGIRTFPDVSISFEMEVDEINKVVPFRKDTPQKENVLKSTVFRQLGENGSFYQASFERRREINPLFNFFGHLLDELKTLPVKDLSEKKQVLEILLGETLPKKYKKIKNRRLSPYRVIYHYWEVLLSEIDPLILEFGQQILSSKKKYTKEEGKEADQKIFDKFEDIYKSMVKKRIYNDPEIQKEDIFPPGLVETTFIELREQLGEDDAFKLLDSFNLALGTFSYDPMMQNNNLSQITVRGLIGHHMVTAEDQLAFIRLFGKDQHAHPSMLLDQTFLEGPQDAHPNYLNYRSKALKFVKHQVGQEFMQDLQLAVVLKGNPSKRKQLQKLSKKLVNRFEALFSKNL